MEIQYGKETIVVELDEMGSSMTDEVTLMDFNRVDNRQRFEIRVKVHSPQEELTEFLKFAEDTRNLSNAEFRIERTARANADGAWYIVKVFTIKKPEPSVSIDVLLDMV